MKGETTISGLIAEFEHARQEFQNSIKPTTAELELRLCRFASQADTEADS